MEKLCTIWTEFPKFSVQIVHNKLKILFKLYIIFPYIYWIDFWILKTYLCVKPAETTELTIFGDQEKSSFEFLTIYESKILVQKPENWKRSSPFELWPDCTQTISLINGQVQSAFLHG